MATPIKSGSSLKLSAAQSSINKANEFTTGLRILDKWKVIHSPSKVNRHIVHAPAFLKAQKNKKPKRACRIEGKVIQRYICTMTYRILDWEDSFGKYEHLYRMTGPPDNEQMVVVFDSARQSGNYGVRFYQEFYDLLVQYYLDPVVVSNYGLTIHMIIRPNQPFVPGQDQTAKSENRYSVAQLTIQAAMIQRFLCLIYIKHIPGKLIITIKDNDVSEWMLLDPAVLDNLAKSYGLLSDWLARHEKMSDLNIHIGQCGTNYQLSGAHNFYRFLSGQCGFGGLWSTITFDFTPAIRDEQFARQMQTAEAMEIIRLWELGFLQKMSPGHEIQTVFETSCEGKINWAIGDAYSR